MTSRLHNTTFKQARPVLWKIEKEFNLNLLTVAGYTAAFELYDLWLIVSKEFYDKWGREMRHDDKVDWKVFVDRIKYCAKNN